MINVGTLPLEWQGTFQRCQLIHLLVSESKVNYLTYLEDVVMEVAVVRHIASSPVNSEQKPNDRGSVVSLSTCRK